MDFNLCAFERGYSITTARRSHSESNEVAADANGSQTPRFRRPLQGTDLCLTGRPLHTRLDEVAGLNRDELTNNRRSRINALKAQAKEASRGACCDRSGRETIAGMRSRRRRADR